MSVPKIIIKKVLKDKNKGIKNRELVNFLIENNYTKSNTYESISWSIRHWNKKYEIKNNKLVLNKKYNNELISRNKKYRDNCKKILEKQDTKIHYKVINKTHIFQNIFNNNKISKIYQCKVNEVSYSGYKYWIKKGMKIKKPEYDPWICKEIERIYFKYKGIYGINRVCENFKKENKIYISRNTVYRYMKYLGLKAIIRKSKKKREIKDMKNPYKNIIERNFKSSEPNKKWFTDVSYIEIKNGWLYLSIIIDGYNDEIISYTISSNNDNKLVMDMILKVEKTLINSQNLIIHSDRGYQYTSNEYIKFLKKYDLIQSTSRKANSLDNRPAEYFFSIIKTECLNLIPLKERSSEKIFIEFNKFINFYNTERPKSNLNFLSPFEFKNNKEYN